MCTESLGSETGSEAGSDDLSISTNFEGRKPAPRNVFFSKELNRGGSLPPPLTTSGFHMRRHREEGRLVIEAMSMAPWGSVFLVERSEGRMRVGVMREEEDEMEEEETEVEGSGNGEEQDTEGNSEIAGGEMGNGKFARPRKCKERGQKNERLVGWPKPFLVAT